jgi:GMP synthase-like glutamine amidotransferase
VVALSNKSGAKRTCIEGIILSGSPYSVYDDDAPHADSEIYTLGVPILGICYGLQVRCCALSRWNSLY